MYYVCVLKNYRDGIRYVGSGESVEERLKRHNKGDYRFTKGHTPWKLVYEEQFDTRSEAVRREKFLKSGKGREYLDLILATPPGSSNGRNPPFGGGYDGSNPSPGGVAGNQ